jgi:short subunit dehydrogenase-like uncharacterized protein
VPETAKAAGHLVLQARDDIRRAVNLMARAEAAERAGYSLREHSAQAAQSFARAEYSMRAARRLFASRSWEDNLQFIIASMGPRSRDRGNWGYPPCDAATGLSFNGAAIT